MKWDLKRPCDHCPFNKGSSTRIKFRTRERAEEIEESAYRNGFVCHEHATLVEQVDEDGGEIEGYDFGPDGEQHCAGALIMYLAGGGGNVPFEWLDEQEQDRITSRLDFSAVVFDSPDEFIGSQEDADE